MHQTEAPAFAAQQINRRLEPIESVAATAYVIVNIRRTVDAQNQNIDQISHRAATRRTDQISVSNNRRDQPVLPRRLQRRRKSAVQQRLSPGHRQYLKANLRRVADGVVYYDGRQFSADCRP